MSNPAELDEAAALLHHLSDDAVAREYAYRRELERIHFENQLQRKYEQGFEQGLREARMAVIAATCKAFRIDLDDERRAQLAKLNSDALKHVLSRIVETRSWPL